MFKIVFILIFMATSFSQDDELADEYLPFVRSFTEAIINQNFSRLDSIILQGIQREYPLPDVMLDDLKQDYSLVFDDYIINMLKLSDPKKDWAYMGWRGLMFKNGLIWIHEDGTLQTVNYQSELEKKRRFQMIEEERKSLHPSVQNYKAPDALISTKRFKIRVDQIDQNTYQYASWRIEKYPKEKPDLVLRNGSKEPDGQIGALYYTFTNNEFTYRIFLSNSLPDYNGQLEVYKNDTLILEEEIFEQFGGQ